MKKFMILIFSVMLLMSLSSVQSFASSDDNSDDSSIETESDDSDDSSENDDSDDSSENDDSGMDGDDDVKSTTPPVMKKEMRPKPPVMLKRGSGSIFGSGSAINIEHREDKEMLKMKREEMKNSIEGNREEAKGNREDFREENGEEFDAVKEGLTAVQKVQLQDLHLRHKTEMDALREEAKGASQEERDALYLEMKALGEKHYADLKALLGTAGSALVDERKAVYEENEVLRDENRAARSEYGELHRATVEKYRRAFIIKLGTTLDSIPADKLPQILERIDTMMEKYEADVNISDSKRELMLSALTAVAEIIQDKIDGDDIETDVLDVVNTLLAE